MKTCSVFAIYFREQCLYIGYSTDVSKYLRNLRDRTKYEEKKNEGTGSVGVLAFMLFYSENYSDCLTITFDTNLDMKTALKIKKDYIARLKPLFNE